MTTLNVPRLRELLAKATLRPWKKCSANNDECSCGLVWSIPVDGTVASTLCHDNPDGPNTNHNNDSRLIVEAINQLPTLLDRLEKYEQALSEAGRLGASISCSCCGSDSTGEDIAEICRRAQDGGSS